MGTTTTTGTLPHRSGDAGRRSAEIVARVGLLAKGVFYLSLGALVARVASGGVSSQQADAAGAVEQVARQPFGQVFLGLLIVGLACLVVWHAYQTVKGDAAEGDEASDRVKYAAKVVTYVVLTGLAVRTLVRGASSSSSSGSGEQKATAEVLGWPGGQWLVGAAGVVLIVVGAAAIYQYGWHKKFLERLNRSRLGQGAQEAVEWAGRAGYTARGVVFGVIGVLLITAALQHDASEAGGLSEALRTLAQQSWGKAVLWFVAVGFVLYGLFALAEARLRRSPAPG